MALLTHDCPHCGAHRAAFTIAGQSAVKGKNHWNVLGICPACSYGVVFLVDQHRGHHSDGGTPNEFRGDISAASQWFLIRATAPSAATTVPEHLPPRVQQAFAEGCTVLSASPSAACSQFRKALEWGLKDLAPEVEAWKLEKRIDKLAAEGKLTLSLKDWAHQLRIDGNEAVHGEENPSREHAKAVEQLTRYVLTYLYTLPKSIEAARSAS